MTVSQGKDVTLQCRATGSPAPVITWFKVDATLPEGSFISDEVQTNRQYYQDSDSDSDLIVEVAVACGLLFHFRLKLHLNHLPFIF